MGREGEHMSLDVEALEASFDLVARRGEEFVDLFYEKLFERAPALKPLFDGVDVKTQRAMVLATLVLLRKSFRGPASIAPKLRALGARHLAYGTTAEMYPLAGEVFLATLAEVAGPAWLERLERAWTQAWELLAGLMLEGAAEAHDPAARAA
jgi:methyl-accepting chemotaxis protein